MFGLMYLVGIIVLVVILTFVYKQSYEVAFKKTKSKVKSILWGLFGFLVVFLIFFGSDLYKYVQFRYICATQTIDKIYDQEAYDRFWDDVKVKKHPRIENKELDLLKQKMTIIEKDVDSVIVDKENNLLYWYRWTSKKNRYSESRIINFETGKTVYHMINYYGHGGWVTKLLSGSSMSDSFGSCKK
ncbi:MAG: hypothetical protein LBU87_06885 [Lactobacillales bacterium]|jgi:uncharacterized membrane protein|nr:hypothetical protein [Lactobacillales bacterium]